MTTRNRLTYVLFVLLAISNIQRVTGSQKRLMSATDANTFCSDLITLDEITTSKKVGNLLKNQQTRTQLTTMLTKTRSSITKEKRNNLILLQGAVVMMTSCTYRIISSYYADDSEESLFSRFAWYYTTLPYYIGLTGTSIAGLSFGVYHYSYKNQLKNIDAKIAYLESIKRT